jgi:hypothetical protein
MPKVGHDDIEPTEGERIDAMEFVARVLVQIPDPSWIVTAAWLAKISAGAPGGPGRAGG